tara:strand:+ start:2352 stop:3281 length:930 start_codon:yes stop_codon:yes gene_type:complete
MAIENYDRTEALIHGTVRPEGIDPVIISTQSGDRHFRMLRNWEFDVCELSMSSYLMAKDQGLPIVAIPVFPRRLFPHSFIYCNLEAGIREPEDLRGRRVGIGMYQVTMSMLAKGFLQHEYGISPESIDWVTGREELLPFEKPLNVKIDRANGDAALETMLMKGEIAARIQPDTIPSLESQPPQVSRLFPNFRELEIQWYGKTGIFPIMHVIALKTEIAERHPWIGQSIMEAFEKAKHLSYEYLKHPANNSLVWSRTLLEEQGQILGLDPFPYGLESNRSAVEQLTQFSYEQGLTKRKTDVDDIFLKLDT